jgi:hypothetical protein
MTSVPLETSVQRRSVTIFQDLLYVMWYDAISCSSFWSATLHGAHKSYAHFFLFCSFPFLSFSFISVFSFFSFSSFYFFCFLFFFLFVISLFRFFLSFCLSFCLSLSLRIHKHTNTRIHSCMAMYACMFLYYPTLSNLLTFMAGFPW